MEHEREKQELQFTKSPLEGAKTQASFRQAEAQRAQTGSIQNYIVV